MRISSSRYVESVDSNDVPRIGQVVERLLGLPVVAYIVEV